MKIGVFDSGIGGLSVAIALKNAYPSVEVIFKNDQKNVPYGDKPLETIYSFSRPIIEELIKKDNCDIIVIACNTVSTNFASRLRKEYKVPIVALEPMVKPATLATKTKVITVCATPRTLESKQYKILKQKYAQNIKIYEPDCSKWSQMIESNQIDEDCISNIVEESCLLGSDQFVLGCTHYHWIEDLIVKKINDRANVMQPENAIIKRVGQIMKQLA